MSRIGKLPIAIPEGVEIKVDGQKITIKGPKGTLVRTIPEKISVKTEDGSLIVELKKDNEALKPLFGTTRAHLANAVHGVKEGWSKVLELVGTGYRAEVSGKTLSILVGYSHPIKVEAPDGITFKVVKTDITIEGYDKELVGLISARIRAVRPPEPYKGKGIKYKDEVIRRKAGKAAKSAGA